MNRSYIMVVTVLISSATSLAQLPDGPVWGRPRAIRPTGANVLFATGDGCGGCHSVSPDAVALRTDTGADASPHGLWESTMMANSFRDPLFRSQLSMEMAARPHEAGEIQGLCLRCHTPMAHHTARIAGAELASVDELDRDPLARDGVSCTVCHQARPDGLGTAGSFSGRLDIRPGRAIFGPYPEPLAGPMFMHSRFRPQQGAHISSSALCGSCHTLFTRPSADAEPFLEQAPYLEWRNSVYTDEDGRTETSRTCQQCHMTDVGSMRIARNPRGTDFGIPDRPNVRAHSIVGGNAFMLEMLRDNRRELGVIAPVEAFNRTIAATRRQLDRSTATLEISDLALDAGTLRFRVKVVNLSGHKLPTGYPSRRLFLAISASVDGRTVFESGQMDGEGRIRGIPAELEIPHYQKVTKESQVVVYEAVADDSNGRPTTLLSEMARYRKDNRLLPRGWRAGGPHADVTRPVGIGDDPDFADGSDTVDFAIPVSAGESASLFVEAILYFQTIPPAWVNAHRSVDTAASRRFTRLYDEANSLAEIITTARVSR